MDCVRLRFRLRPRFRFSFRFGLRLLSPVSGLWRPPPFSASVRVAAPILLDAVRSGLCPIDP